LANCLAQCEALMRGRTADEAQTQMRQQGLDEATLQRLAPHRTFPGNRPSNLLMFDKLTPRTLGAMIALYEHKIYVQGVLWGVNSFDQWGVELGKQLAGAILPQLQDEGAPQAHDGSTAGLIRHARQKLRQSS
jgi:glucose-6-phosphate isomerase